MQISVHSNIGRRRSSNQDYADYYTSKAKQVLFILCDGVGGNQAGDVASKMTTEYIGKEFQNIDQSLTWQAAETWLTEIVDTVNQEVYDLSLSKDEYKGMSTTLVMALAADDQLVICHVGDSRAYIFNEEGLNQVTDDHSLVNELIRSGEITELEGEHHPQRNIVTQAIGGTDQVESEINHFDLSQVDYLLLCSDGLSNMVNHKQMLEYFKSYQSLDTLGEALIDAANEAGGSDNITVVLASDLMNEEVTD